jgi:hypothetical protein
LANIISGPCPKCGGYGHFPDGVYDFINDTIRIISAPQRTFEELSRLTEILVEAKEKQQSNKIVSEKIKIQKIPL